MPVRTPVKLDNNGDIVAMDATDLANIRAEMIRQYGLNPSVTVGVVASGGNLGTLTDTRYQAGSSVSSISAFPSEATTPEPTQIGVSYSRMQQTVSSLSAPPDTNQRAFPLYLDASNNLQAMTVTDMYDTFVNDVVATLTTAAQTTNQAGTFTIHTSTVLSGCTLMSATPVFTDTRADLTLYSAAGIPEALDQPITITNYYLFRIDPAAAGTIPQGLFLRSDNDLQQYTTAQMSTMLGDLIRFYATQTGSFISYNLNTDVTGARGSGIVNTDHTGVTGDYQVRFITADDYRAQEFPNGTPSTITTNYLKCLRG